MNNNQSTTEYLERLKTIKLSDSSRARIQRELLEYTEFHAVPEGVRDAEAVRSIKRVPRRTLLAPFKFSFMPYVLLIALMVGGGTSFAAQGAVPGDFLYPMKTEVNESVRSAFTFGADNEADLQAKLIAERLEEAEALESEGRLSAEASATLATQLRQHATKAGIAIEQSTETETLALGSSITVDLERFNALVNNDMMLAVDLGAMGRTEADSSVTTSMMAREIDIDQLRTMTEARLNNVTEVVNEEQSELSAEVYASFSSNLEAASELSVSARAAAEADARQAYNRIAELVGEVEAELSTLGTLEIDQNTGAIVGVDFSRVPPTEMSDEERNNSITGGEASVDMGIMSDEGTTSIEADADLNLDISLPSGEAEAESSSSIRSGLSL